ncbi:MAG: hypothetical protein JNM99_08545 [Verrucomicrobiaceae bacterium]|nr:hypothetical protein [Verrucomicrobiaceae bacterium]
MSIKFQRAAVTCLVSMVVSAALLVIVAASAWNSIDALSSIHVRFHSLSIWERLVLLRIRELGLKQAQTGMINEALLAGFRRDSLEDLIDADEAILAYAKKAHSTRDSLVLAARVSLNRRDKEKALAFLDQAARKPDDVSVLDDDISDKAIQEMRERWQSLTLSPP